MSKRLIFILIAIFILTLWFFFRDAITLENLQSALGSIQSWAEARPFTFILIFGLIYVITAASSLPFASLLTLLAGAVLGFWTGTIVVSIASTLGATLAFWLSRYLFGEQVQSRYAQQLKKVNEGVKTDGALYLFSLRMVPLFPFFLVNILAGLTPLKTRTYLWVSWLGMLPATAIYVFAGRNLAQIDSLTGILSPSMILSLTLLGIFPWFAKFVIDRLRARKVYEGYDKPKSFDRNLVVIGAGSAGLVASYMAAASKAKVTLVENNLMGGDCLNFGCIPSKALIKTAKVAAQMKHADRYGLKPAEPQFSLADVSARIKNTIAAIEPNDSIERYTSLGVDVVEGFARIIDPWHVEITPHEGAPYQLSTSSIVIATGATPFVPPIAGLSDTEYLTSGNLWEKLSISKDLPKKLLVLGGGNIGLELSQALARLGVNVTILEMANRVLPREDEEVSKQAQSALEADGVKILTNHKAVEFSAKTCVAEHKGERVEVPFDEVLIAVGRKARLEGFGLEELGVKTDHAVKANGHLQTNFPNIYVAGDATGPYQFTHMAGYEGTYAALNALFGRIYKFKLDYRVVPMVTFTAPEIARVGINESEAQAKNIAYDVTLYPLEKLDRAETESATSGFVKIITPKGKDKILGVTIVSEHAGEMLSEFTLAMKYKIGLKKILSTIHPYPTWGEAAKNASGLWSNAHLSARATAVSKWYLDRVRK